MNIIFFGTPDFAVPALNNLVNFGYNITAVVTQPEKPVGRARVIMPSPIKKVALEKSIMVFEPHNLKRDEEFFKKFEHLNPDLCVVAAYGKIIPKRYLEIPKYGFLNVHPSLLPKYRGPSPVQTAILNGDVETGVSIMLIDQEIDHGPVLASSKYQVVSSKGNVEISNELFKLGAKLLVETLPKYINGEIRPVAQNHRQATFTKMFKREDGRIDWSKPTKEIYNQIRALNPEPGTWTMWKDKIINIKAASVKTSANQGKPTLEIEIIQMEGKKEMPFKEFLNGYPDFDPSPFKRKPLKR